MTNTFYQIEQLTKKLNAIVLCHLPLVFLGIMVLSGLHVGGIDTDGMRIMYAMSAISLPPLLLIFMRRNTSTDKGSSSLESLFGRLTLALLVMVHVTILTIFPNEKNLSLFRFFASIEQTLLVTYIFQKIIEDFPSRWSRVGMYGTLLNVFVIFVIATLTLATRGQETYQLKLLNTVTANAAITALLAIIALYRKNYPNRNSRLHGIICYSVLQSSILHFIFPIHFTDAIVSLLSLGTIFAISLDFILLKPSVLLENGFFFLNTQRNLRAKIAKVSKDLKLQEEKTTRVERELTDTVLLAAATLDSMSVQVCILDTRGMITSSNNAWRDFHAAIGVDAIHFSPQGFYIEGCEKDTSSNNASFKRLAADLKTVMQGQQAEICTQQLYFLGSQRRWLMSRITRFDSTLGLRYMIVQEDITELKRTEEELRLKSIAIERANDGIVLTDPTLPDNPIVYVSYGFLKLTGYTQEEVIGRNCRFMQGPESDPTVIKRMRDAIANEQSFVGEIVNYRKDGKAWVNRLKLEPVRNEEGKLIRYVGVQLDVTAAKKLESERKAALEKETAARKETERLYREAQQANTIKDEFLATLSHELRTPAGVIVGFTELLKYEDMSAEEKEEALDALERNARSLVTLIDDMLDMSRVITGKLKLNPKPVDLASIVESVIAAETLAAQTKNIRLVTEFEPGAGPIYGDTTRLQQIFWNLLSNAIKFTPRNGRVKVSVKSEGSRVVARVIDTGIGIEPKFLPHVFERFRQQESGTNRSYGGLGLGLSIVKHLVELHGGTVAAESAGVGRGATFIVKLPTLTAAI
ncbi:MAG: hypothetical protein RI932_790 [Pseudomonadota bacterium]|jgi:PAS domain S-box-containing protein